MGNTEQKYAKPSDSTTTHSWDDSNLSDLEIGPQFGGTITAKEAKTAADAAIKQNADLILSQIYIKINKESILGNKTTIINLSELIYEIMEELKEFPSYSYCFGYWWLCCYNVEYIHKKFPFHQHVFYINLIQEQMTEYRISYKKQCYQHGCNQDHHYYSITIKWE